MPLDTNDSWCTDRDTSPKTYSVSSTSQRFDEREEPLYVWTLSHNNLDDGKYRCSVPTRIAAESDFIKVHQETE